MPSRVVRMHGRRQTSRSPRRSSDLRCVIDLVSAVEVLILSVSRARLGFFSGDFT